MNTLLIVALGVAVVWFCFRIFWFVRKLLRRRRERRVPGVRCPACGSRRLDDYSDADSGMCLACQHIWGVDMPSRP